MSFDYTYPASAFNTPNNKVDLASLQDLIVNSPDISIAMVSCTRIADIVHLYFQSALSGPEYAALNAIVASYSMDDVPVANIAMGMGALANNRTGSDNTALGCYSVKVATIPSGLTAIGCHALENTVTALENTAVGTCSMQMTTIGNSNTSLGFHTLQANTTGSYNAGVGASALLNSVTGSGNTALGYRTLEGAVGGTDNTAIGKLAGTAALGSRNTFVGAGADIGLVQSTFGAQITTASSDQTILANPTVSPTSTYMIANRIFQSITYPTAMTQLPLDTDITIASCPLPDSNNAMVWLVSFTTIAAFTGGIASDMEMLFVQALNYNGIIVNNSKIVESSTLKTTGIFTVTIGTIVSGTTVHLRVYIKNNQTGVNLQCMAQITDLTPGVSRRPVFAN